MRNIILALSGRRKVFYGWWLLAGSVVAMALGSGVSYWSFGEARGRKEGNAAGAEVEHGLALWPASRGDLRVGGQQNDRARPHPLLLPLPESTRLWLGGDGDSIRSLTTTRGRR